MITPTTGSARIPAPAWAPYRLGMLVVPKTGPNEGREGVVIGYVVASDHPLAETGPEVRFLDNGQIFEYIGQAASNLWRMGKTSITINCERGQHHTECHGWANPGVDILRCVCSCHQSWNPAWDYGAEAEAVLGTPKWLRQWTS
jgi:hypothetical protein